MAIVGVHFSHFIQHDTRSVLEWVSTVSKWLGFAHFGSVLERADQGFHLADAAADTIQLYQAAKKVSDWTSVGRVLSKGSSLVGNVASSIDFLHHIQAITLESGLLSRIAVVGDVASLIRNTYKVARLGQKVFQEASLQGGPAQLKVIRHSTQLVRTIIKIACAILALGMVMGLFAVSSTALLILSSAALILATTAYLLKREIHRLEN
ncbi:MAG: hypothetical protein KBC64_04385 [Simkaniaceae bacterium]|nr:hypothetical protein [Simkaniaceae bacterium]